jgi:mRNA interferase MazF
MAKRFEVWIVRFDPTVGSEIAKTRPAVIVSPDDANDVLKTVIVAPLTSTLKQWPTRVPVTVRRKAGEVALDQLRTVDKSRLANKTATLSAAEAKDVSDRLVEMLRL